MVYSKIEISYNYKMSSMRPGTAHALSLMKCMDADSWNRELQRYDLAVKTVADKKKKKELILLDQWLWNQYPTDVESRNPRHFTIDELSKIMEWKLLRGKFRPALQGLIKQNSPNNVIQISEASLALLRLKKWKAALKKLSELRGVGPATASAVLAPLDPDVPFMADEVLEAATKRPRTYTLGAYEEMRDTLITTNTHLGESGALSLEGLGKALWSRAILGADEEYEKDDNAMPSNVASDRAVKTVAKRKGPIDRTDIVPVKSKRRRR